MAAGRKRSFIFPYLIILIGLYGFQMTFISKQVETFMDHKTQAKELRTTFTESRKVKSTTITSASTKSTIKAKKKISFWELNRMLAESKLQSNGPSDVRKTITAYLEQPLNDTVPGTGYQYNPDNKKDKGAPPDFYIPLPVRTTTPADLKTYEYPKFQTCHDLPAKLPVDRGLEMDAASGRTIVRNVGNVPTPEDYPWQEAPYCPVDADPFLPWIHDVFPSPDGTKIEFIAQNKRRCKSGAAYYKDTLRMTPQVALLQPVSVQRINEQTAKQLAPELWHDDHDQSPETISTTSPPRYRLAPYEQASKDGMWTRFICRIHTTNFRTGQPKIWETLSEYPINYEFAGYRKNRPQLLVPQGRETNLFWSSTLMFSCPIPKELQPTVKGGSSILSDGTPTLHVDVIPIRTSPRYGSKEVYFTEAMAGAKRSWATNGNTDTFNHTNIAPGGFNATLRWGSKHVLPKVEASGRWTNLPICQVPKIPAKQTNDTAIQEITQSEQAKKKPHQLAACLWSSASFTERGISQDHNRQKDTTERLKEWIEFHLMVGFDHIYVYDNSGAHTNSSSLEEVTNQFPASQVTRIDWPSLLCNNNIPAHPSPGERSSQYAAENSCRTRFGGFSEWMASFDTDEYLVPMGNYTSLKQVVDDLEKNGTNILTFRSTRGKLRYAHTRAGEHHDKDSRGKTTSIVKTLEKLPNVTFLEAYNCDSSPLPKSKYGDRAKKQIYRTDHVLNHFVHYSTVTKPYMEYYQDATNKKKWPRIIGRDATERVSDEINEAVMVHTKIVTPKNSRETAKRCHYTARSDSFWSKRGCFVGFPSPNGTAMFGKYGNDGMEYNCFVNRKVENFWLPRLKERLWQRKGSLVVDNNR